jgi:hypothetical protein
MANLNTFANNFGWLDFGIYWMMLLPAIVGVFVGAPLVARELENGTFRFVWLQSVTRTRWFIAKVVALLAACLLAATALSGIIAWSMEPLVRVDGIQLAGGINPLIPPLFDLTGIALPAATLLALSLGILAGTMTRRIILAMFVTILLFAMVRVPVTLARPHFAAPVTASSAVSAGGNRPDIPPGSLVLKGRLCGREWQDVRPYRRGGRFLCFTTPEPGRDGPVFSPIRPPHVCAIPTSRSLLAVSGT